MKKLIYIVLVAFTAHFSTAQEGQIHIQQNQQIERLLELYKSALSTTEYYKIQVGFGDFAKAQNIKYSVERDFPGLFSKIDFDSPTYRVRIGRFKSKLEAERMYNEVRKKYPNAMLLKPKKST